MSRVRKARVEVEERWFEAPYLTQLKMAAVAWRDGASKDLFSNHRLLDLFAVVMVKHFKAEEIRLERMHDTGLAWHRREHFQLVRQLWELMSDEHLGLDVTEGIHRFLEAWLLHEEPGYLRREDPSSTTH
jgi:hemerythrin